MYKKYIGLSTVDITNKEIDYVIETLKSNKISPGSKQKQFENLMCKINNYKHATYCNSGQSALHLAFETLKLKHPNIKYVVCPATTYISTLFAVWNSNLEVVLEDVDINTFNMEQLQKDYNNKFCICPVNLMGLSANNSGFYNYISNIIVEDNAESLCSPNTGFGDIMCTSFYASHQITTGSGGMTFTNDPEYDIIIKSLCNHGRINANDLYALNTDGNFDRNKRFIFDKVGFSFKMSDINAALGLAQAERINEIIQNNITIAIKLINVLQKYQYLKLPQINNNTFMNLTIMTPYKNRLVQHLNEYHIETRDIMPIINQPVVNQKLNIDPTKYPNSQKIIDQGFYIGCHKDITDNDIDYIDNVFQRFVL